MKNRAIITATLSAATCLATQAAAVELSFSGVFASEALAGASYSGRIVYDENVAGVPVDVGFAFYSSTPSLFEVTVNGQTFVSNINQTASVIDDAPFDQVSFNGGNLDWGSMNLVFQFGSVISGTALPNFNQLTQFEEVVFALSTIEMGFGIDRSVAFEQAAIPEPATWALMIAGFGLVGSALRRSYIQPS